MYIVNLDFSLKEFETIRKKYNISGSDMKA